MNKERQLAVTYKILEIGLYQLYDFLSLDSLIKLVVTKEFQYQLYFTISATPFLNWLLQDNIVYNKILPSHSKLL